MIHATFEHNGYIGDGEERLVGVSEGAGVEAGLDFSAEGTFLLYIIACGTEAVLAHRPVSVRIAHREAKYLVGKLANRSVVEAAVGDGIRWKLIHQADEVGLVLVAGGEVVRGRAVAKIREVDSRKPIEVTNHYPGISDEPQDAGVEE